MEAPLSLRRPSNWQDFETLCKKLWGEIWDCPEIKKNGRMGQTQHGVDVYGIPSWEKDYYGIQCKGKDEYTDKQFSENEILEEIEKAKEFQPPLKKLYLTTTAIKDVKIEQFVREKNLDHISNGLFEIHIFSWEDIVDLIDENRQTHDWYVKNQNYKSNKSVSVTFQNGLTELIITPCFKKIVTICTQKAIPANPLLNMATFSQQVRFAQIQVFNGFRLSNTQINKSFCGICFQIHNTGIESLEDFELLFKFEGNLQEIAINNEVATDISFPNMFPHSSNVTLIREEKEGKIVPMKTRLVGDGLFSSDKFFIKPFPNSEEINVKWKLIAKDFKDKGELKIIVRPDIARDFKEILVEDPFEVGIKNSEIEEVLVDKE